MSELVLARSSSLSTAGRPHSTRRTSYGYEATAVDGRRLWSTASVDKQEVLKPLDYQSPMMSHLQQCVTALTDELDEESQPPTEAALGQARSILSEVSTWHAPLAEHALPSISAVGDGDLIVEWRGERKAVLLFLLPSGTCRLQQVDLSEENLSVSEVARNPSARQVAASLAWLGRSQVGDQAQ